MEKTIKLDLEQTFVEWVEHVNTRYNLSTNEINQISNISIRIFGMLLSSYIIHSI